MVVVLGGTGNYQTVVAPVVLVKKAWSDEWEYRPDLRVEQVAAATASEGGSSASLSRPYGWIKWPWRAALEAVSRIDLADYWVAIRAAHQGEAHNVFAGRIKGVGREVLGADAGDAGIQYFDAAGPEHLLEAISVSESYWWDHDRLNAIQWLPDLNARDVRGDVTGNRSAEKHAMLDGTQAYCFGGHATWTHLEFLEYLLACFLNGGDGPPWRVTGQTSLLAARTSPIRFGESSTLAEMLARLIPVGEGLDYCVLPGVDGWELRVFSLNTKPWSFGGVTLPTNPNRVRVLGPSDASTRSVRVATDGARAVGRIRVFGERVLVCCTIRGIEAYGEWDTSMVACWTDALETEYKAGDPSFAGTAWDAGPDLHDRYRQRAKFAPVYQHFAAHPSWDRVALKTSPWVLPDGTVASEGGTQNYQRYVAETEDWIPLKHGFDYSLPGTPAAENAFDATGTLEQEYRPLQIWITDPMAQEIFSDTRFSLVDYGGTTVTPSKKSIGFQLKTPCNHLLARNWWSPAEGQTNVAPRYDWRTLIATLAFRADQRLGVTAEKPGGAKPEDGKLDLFVEGAELWCLAPNTVVSVDADGALAHSSAQLRTLRTDADRLFAAMAGAMARYWSGRVRAEIAWNVFLPVGALLGNVLELVQGGAGLQTCDAPITRAVWTFPRSDREPPSTTIFTGFAQ